MEIKYIVLSESNHYGWGGGFTTLKKAKKERLIREERERLMIIEFEKIEQQQKAELIINQERIEQQQKSEQERQLELSKREKAFQDHLKNKENFTKEAYWKIYNNLLSSAWNMKRTLDGFDERRALLAERYPFFYSAPICQTAVDNNQLTHDERPCRYQRDMKYFRIDPLTTTYHQQLIKEYEKNQEMNPNNELNVDKIINYLLSDLVIHKKTRGILLTYCNCDIPA
jgi:hypothetical protein